MRISTKGRYGIRACLELVKRFGGSAVQISQIAGAQGIPEKYLAQLIPLMRRAGLVKSVRGAKGGYVLARPPAQIKVIEVVEALEGPLAPVECVNDPGLCERFSYCSTRILWSRVLDSIKEALGALTLEDLHRMEKEDDRPDSLAYCI